MTKSYLVFMDIDGTLVDDQQRISSTTQQTIMALQDVADFYVATGRMYASAKIVAADINADIVASNGSIYDLAGQQYTKQLGPDALQLIANALAKQPLPAFFFTDHQVFYTQDLPDYFKNSDTNRIASPNPADYVKLPSPADLPAHADTIINGIIIADQDTAGLTQMRQALAQTDAFILSSSASNNLELIPKHSGKAAAILAIQEQTSIDAAHTFVFGDGDNDVDMFGVADYAVAMGNASSTVKQQAKFTTGTNYEDGIATFLNAHLKGSLIHD